MTNYREVAYYIEISLETDGDYSWIPELFHVAEPEWIDIRNISSTLWHVKIFADTERKMWQDGGWSDYVARNFISNFISAIHVGGNHLFIWKYFLDIEHEINKWITYKTTEKSYCWCLSGNYTGTEIRIFDITNKSVAGSDMIIEPVGNKTYEGKQITPSIKVTDTTIVYITVYIT